jgi:hypothetical protein
MSIATRDQLLKLAQQDWNAELGPGGSELDYRTAIAHFTRAQQESSR